MALELRVNTLTGELCTVDVDGSMLVKDLKAAIAAKAEIPAAEQKLMCRAAAGWDLNLLSNASTLADAGIESGSEVILVRVQPYNGKYEVDIQWNGAGSLQILGSHAKFSWEGSGKGFEAEIQWDEADERKAYLRGRTMSTSYWAKHYTKGAHSQEQGVEEELWLTFSGDSAADGCAGKFQREYEGALPLKGRFLGEDVDE